MEKVTWRGTAGVGDFMWALNVCHLYAYQNNVEVNLEFHWPHEPDYLYHFEDPETILERLDYINKFYHRRGDVDISHRWNGESDRYEPVTDKNRNVEYKTRYWFESGKYLDSGPPPPNEWLFRQDAFKTRNQKKVVIWRPLFNAETPRLWKRRLTNDHWEGIIKKLRREGMKVVELTYRTPVSEAFYHLSDARLVICYDGMWHYIAKNFATPMIVISRGGITKYHTPNAIRASDNPEEKYSIFYWMDRFDVLLGHSKKKAIEYYDRVKYIYEDRQSSN